MQVAEFILVVLLHFASVHWTLSMVCDETTIPYRVAISADGDLQLSCVQPYCFIKSDIDALSLDQIDSDDEKSRHIMKGTCSSVSWASSCSGDQHWFGGIASLNLKKCCSHQDMNPSEKILVRNMDLEEVINGGVVLGKNHESAFDFISDVRQIESTETNEVSYVVTVSRMPCIREAEEILNKVPKTIRTSLVSTIDEKYPRKSVAARSADNNENNKDSKAPESHEDLGRLTLNPPPKTGSVSPSNTGGTVGPELAPSEERVAIDFGEDFDKWNGLIEKSDESCGETDTDGCFTSPSGHKCCSRELERIMKEMQKMVLKKNSDAIETDIKRDMFSFIKDESAKIFCRGEKFDVVIGNGDFAAQTNVPKTRPNACKMAISFKQKSRDGGSIVLKKYIVLAKEIVSRANDANSMRIAFKAAKEIPNPNCGKRIRGAICTDKESCFKTVLDAINEGCLSRN